MKRLAARVGIAASAALLAACAVPEPAPRAATPPPQAPPTPRRAAPSPADAATVIVGDDAKPVRDVAISPDGMRVAVLRTNDVLELLDARSGESLREAKLGPGAPPVGSDHEPVLRFAEDGSKLTWGERAWSVPQLEPATVTPAPPSSCEQRDSQVVALRGLDDRTATRLAGGARKLRIGLRREGEWTVLTPAPKDGPLQLTSDCRWIWREGNDGVDVLRATDGAAGTFAPWTRGISGMEAPMGGWASVEFGPSLDRFIVYSTSQQGAVYIFSEPRLIDGATMKVVAPLHEDCQSNRTLWSPAGRWILRRDCFSSALFVHDGLSGRLLRTDELLAPRGFTRDERTLAALYGNGAAVLDVESGRRALEIRGGETSTDWSYFTPDGGALVTRSRGRITRWDLTIGAHAAIETHWEPTSQNLVDPTASFAWQERYTGGSDIVDLTTMTSRHVEGQVLHVGADGIAAIVEPKGVRVTGPGGRTLGAFAIERGVRARAVAVSAGGKWAAVSRDEDGRVELFEVAPQRRVATFATPASKPPKSRYDGSDQTAAMVFRPGSDEVALLRASWEGPCTLAVASATARKIVRSVPIPSCSSIIAWTRDGEHLLVGGYETLEVYAADLAAPPRVLVASRGYQYPGTLERLAAASADLAALEQRLRAPAPATPDGGNLRVDPTGRFAVRVGDDGLVLVRVADDARLRLFSGQVLARTGAIVIAPDATFDASSRDMEDVLQANGQPLTEAERSERRRPNLLRAFVGAARSSSPPGR